MPCSNRVHRASPLTEEEKEHLKPVSLDELEKLMDELGDQAPPIAQQPFMMAMPRPASNASGIVVHEPPKDRTPPRTQPCVSVEIQQQPLPFQTYHQLAAMTPKGQKTAPASTPPSPTPTTLTTPVKRSLERTLALESESPSNKKRRTSPRKPTTATTSPNPSTRTSTNNNTPQPKTPKSQPMPQNWESSSPEDRLLFQLKKPGESWKEIATEWNRITGQEYSQKTLSGRWNRIKASIGLPPEGLDLDVYSSGTEEI